MSNSDVGTDTGLPAQQYAEAEHKKQKTVERDINRFIALYKSFGIELTIEKDGDGYRMNPDGMIVRLHEAVDKRLAIGDEGIVSVAYFDKDGKFIEQGFWE